MKSSTMIDRLWGNKAKISYLMLASACLLLTLLGSRDIWTQEHRWADIVFGMFYRQDFFHPYLGESQYYDKPLLSYWLIAFVAKITGELSTWSLRLPSALSGLLAIYSIYRIGITVKNKSLGLLAGWLLLTTFYFLFWARTSSADMLNLAGSLWAVSWYRDHRQQSNFFAYAVFFIAMALTSLCKGLVGMIIPVMAVGIDIVLQRSWKQHCRPALFFGLIPALVIYLVPFWLSTHIGGQNYQENGLYLVYRENILRYFQPFDHQGSIFTYFIYLPIYLLPWTIFLIPTLFTLPSRWKKMSIDSRWIAWTLLGLFLFFTLSGSRRSYYVLPIVPYAILLIADWMSSDSVSIARRQWSAVMVICSFLFLWGAWDVVPAYYDSHYGTGHFAALLKAEVNQEKPWQDYQVVMLDAESKLNFYLQLPPNTKNYQVKGDERIDQTASSLAKRWPILQDKPANTIFITRKLYADLLQPFFMGYRRVVSPSVHLFFLKERDMSVPVAFIPPA